MKESEISGSKRGSLHVAMGRGRTGKSTGVRFLVGRAEANRRTVIAVDADRTNSTLASFVPEARRPRAADDETCFLFLEDVISEAVADGGSYLVDMGGGDRLFLTMSERHNLPSLLAEHGVDLTLHHYVAGGRDDLETFHKCVATGLVAARTLIMLNEGLAGNHPSTHDPFAGLLSGRTVRQAIDQGARVVRIPAVPLATMVKADELFISIQSAAAGRVPSDEHGQPAPGATPLGLFRRLELTKWLKTLEDRYQQAGVTEWLP